VPAAVSGSVHVCIRPAFARPGKHIREREKGDRPPWLMLLPAWCETAPFYALHVLHSGRVTDYVVWMMVEMAVLAGWLKFE
jgi:hypothetical protein